MYNCNYLPDFVKLLAFVKLLDSMKLPDFVKLPDFDFKLDFGICDSFQFQTKLCVYARSW